ncbi:MAG: ATP-grasp domain-containing protein [Alphaproteobacteria bacterium]|nr:ATP-grasp domain-containing protein [Alphaproteobacteria bacterium]
MFGKVLVANRSAVAARVLRALDGLGVPSVAVYSDADAAAPYLAVAGEAVRIGEGPARQSYLDQDRVIEAALASGCDAVHPGYGFLAENAGFARRVTAAGMTFIGPAPRFIDAMGHKTRARELARELGLPVAAGSGVLPADREAARAAARDIGYPVMVKPAAGGGGIGMIAARDEDALAAAVEKASSLAARGFGNGEVYLERLLDRPRHIEFQVLGDRHGDIRHLFERDCSVQRRNQKILEEAPAPGPADGVDALAGRVADGLRRLGYDNIGTVEMLMAADGTFTFLEMNTRLQVEHGVTEAITGIDLVAAQIRSAAGEKLSAILPAEIARAGHAIEARICAEDPVRFFPSAGRLDVFRLPADARVETGYAEGGTVTPFYDSLLAKIIAHGPTRADATARLVAALEATEIVGVKTNVPALLRLLRSQAHRDGRLHTGLVPEVLQ